MESIVWDIVLGIAVLMLLKVVLGGQRQPQVIYIQTEPERSASNLMWLAAFIGIIIIVAGVVLSILYPVSQLPVITTIH